MVEEHPVLAASQGTGEGLNIGDAQCGVESLVGFGIEALFRLVDGHFTKGSVIDERACDGQVMLGGGGSVQGGFSSNKEAIALREA